MFRADNNTKISNYIFKQYNLPSGFIFSPILFPYFIFIRNVLAVFWIWMIWRQIIYISISILHILSTHIQLVVHVHFCLLNYLTVKTKNIVAKNPTSRFCDWKNNIKSDLYRKPLSVCYAIKYFPSLRLARFLGTEPYRDWCTWIDP